uniref:Putative secreted protein ovary overexpressed n=1 Tax=Rhipicephalus microplus TaxID=6941 RepID=A0A6M2DB42_RHIMP
MPACWCLLAGFPPICNLTVLQEYFAFKLCDCITALTNCHYIAVPCMRTTSSCQDSAINSLSFSHCTTILHQ